MRHEIVFALVAGGVLGLVIAFGIWRINAALNSGRTNQTSISSPTPASTAQFGITLAKPEDLDVVVASPQTFSGITKPDAWVVISTDTNDYFVQAKGDGTFTQDVKLGSGVNQIAITAFSETGESATTKLMLIYSSEFAKETPSALAQDTSTNEADIRQKIIKKVQEAVMRPKAYIGVVTDISGGTIQIKTQEGQIQQISANPDSLTVIKVGKTNKGMSNSSAIKLTDIAIGDFIVALGFKNGNNVLDARRILTMPPITEPGILALYGGVTKVEKKDIIVTQVKSQEQTKVLVGASTDILREKGQKKVAIKLSDLNEGDLIIAVVSKDTLMARTIFVVQPRPSPSPLPTSK